MALKVGELEIVAKQKMRSRLEARQRGELKLKIKRQADVENGQVPQERRRSSFDLTVGSHLVVSTEREACPPRSGRASLISQCAVGRVERRGGNSLIEVLDSALAMRAEFRGKLQKPRNTLEELPNAATRTEPLSARGMGHRFSALAGDQDIVIGSPPGARPKSAENGRSIAWCHSQSIDNDVPAVALPDGAVAMETRDGAGHRDDVGGGDPSTHTGQAAAAAVAAALSDSRDFTSTKNTRSGKAAQQERLLRLAERHLPQSCRPAPKSQDTKMDVYSFEDEIRGIAQSVSLCISQHRRSKPSRPMH